MSSERSGGAKPETMGTLARIGAGLADWSERWFPDAYVFAAIAVVIVCIAALFMGRTPMQVGTDFGKSFWSLIPFTMQMSFVVIGGYILAVAPPVKRLLVALARVPKAPRGAVAYVAFPSVPMTMRQTPPWSLPLRAEVTSSHGHAAHPLRKDSCRWLRNRGRPCVPGMGTGLEVKVLRGARW